ncbi:MAG: hypothetical protein GEU99_00260 [Luteitalea sp.]|nr:hypothetical protein [Luteitalea sp.]
MPRTATEQKAETVTFRIDRGLKAAFLDVAEQESKPVGQLLRELVRERVERKRREELETEARRQSRECAAAAGDPNSDEAAVMRELDMAFNELVDREEQT